MSDLEQYKMPIIEGINAQPSTDGEPTHPNASLFCKQYNDLINNLELEQNLTQNIINNFKLNTQGSERFYNYVVDSIDGDDNNEFTLYDEYSNPLRTFDEVHRRIERYKTYGSIIIFVRGTFTNPDLDFTKHSFISSDPFWANNGGKNRVQIISLNGPSDQPVITFDNNHLDPNNFTEDIPNNSWYFLDEASGRQLIRSNIPFEFRDITFNLTENACILLDRTNTEFYNCTFTLPITTQWFRMSVTNSAVKFVDTDIVNNNTDITLYLGFIHAYNSRISVKNNNNNSGIFIVDAELCNLYLDLPIGYSVKGLRSCDVATRTTGNYRDCEMITVYYLTNDVAHNVTTILPDY